MSIDAPRTGRRRVFLSAPLLLLAAACLAPGPASAVDAEILHSVVSVLPDWPRQQMGTEERRRALEEPEGSGVAVIAGGYVVTNHHVLGRATTVNLRRWDGRILSAEIVGRDAATDLAVLKAETDLPILAGAPKPKLGAPVCAIGNQFGLGLSVTCGVVSAIHRTGTGFNPIEDFVQTDAAVNPGASGGALVDEQGRLVGVTSAIFNKGVDANIGVNFATSHALVMRVVEDIVAHGRVRRARSGLRVEDLSQEEKRRLVGAHIVTVRPGSAAEAAGAKAGDVVTAVGGRPTRKASDVSSALQLYRPGDRVELTIARMGKSRQVILELAP